MTGSVWDLFQFCSSFKLNNYSLISLIQSYYSFWIGTRRTQIQKFEFIRESFGRVSVVDC